MSSGLNVLIVDDEPPALEELRYLLDADDRVGPVHIALDGATALRTLDHEHIDALFLDIRMPRPLRTRPGPRAHPFRRPATDRLRHRL